MTATSDSEFIQNTADTKTSPRPFCFVIMPFSKDFDDVYKFGIKLPVTKAGAYCERVDEQDYQERILDRIYNQIAKADVIIADMTGRNANVLYEVGYAHALGKLTVLLTCEADDIPFNLKPFQHIVYGKSIESLSEQLTKKIEWCLNNLQATTIQSKFGLQLYFEGHVLPYSDAVYCTKPFLSPSIEIIVNNCSGMIIEGNAIKIGVITDDNFRISGHASYLTKLLTGESIYMLSQVFSLLPDESTTVFIVLEYKSPPYALCEDSKIIIRVFTKSGTRDFPILLKKAGE